MYIVNAEQDNSIYLTPFFNHDTEANGMLLLQDVYCLYNRARGSELISPGI